MKITDQKIMSVCRIKPSDIFLLKICIYFLFKMTGTLPLKRRKINATIAIIMIAVITILKL